MIKEPTVLEIKVLESIQKVIDKAKPEVLARALLVAIIYGKIPLPKRSDK